MRVVMTGTWLAAGSAIALLVAGCRSSGKPSEPANGSAEGLAGARSEGRMTSVTLNEQPSNGSDERAAPGETLPTELAPAPIAGANGAAAGAGGTPSLAAQNGDASDRGA